MVVIGIQHTYTNPFTSLVFILNTDDCVVLLDKIKTIEI